MSFPSAVVLPRRLVVLAAGSALALTACGAPTQPVSAPHSSASTTAARADDDAPLVLERGWVKASSASMTGAFGILRNEGDAPLRVVSATSPAAARVELHDTVKDADGQLQMQQVEGGFVVPPRSRLVLEPGGRHVMLMGLQQPVEAGTTVDVTLTSEEGEVLTVELPVREFAGAEETYAPHASTTSPSTTHAP